MTWHTIVARLLEAIGPTVRDWFRRKHKMGCRNNDGYKQWKLSN